MEKMRTPTQRSVLEDLLGKVERLKGPSRELDFAIWQALFPPDPAKVRPRPEGMPASFGKDAISAAMDQRPKITGGVDQALALVKRVLPLASAITLKTMHQGVTGGHCFLHGPSSEYASDMVEHGVAVNQATMPLAILAALLKAKLAEATDPATPSNTATHDRNASRSTDDRSTEIAS